jgi:nicotinate-nucleotide adenylyltransferase
MKLAILGGSFNPIHTGHLYLADTVLCELGYGRVLLIPALVSPFKREADAIPAQDRLDMLLAAAAADPRLGVDDTEIRRGGVSFTIDTVTDIIERYRPEGKPGLVIGDDLAADFPQWKNAGELAAKADIIIARRLDEERSLSFPFPHTSLKNAVLPVSSASVREKIASSGAWRSLLPQGARCIIEERGLYGYVRSQPAGKNSLPGQPEMDTHTGLSIVLAVENAARAVLKSSRFLHSRNTALMAYDLARRFGLDPRAAYLAGIGHDLGKALNDNELLALAKRDGKRFSAMERKKPRLLHGRAAAVLLSERFGIHNKEVLEAVACHTTGKRGMGPLAQVVYIADKIEYSRRSVDSRFRERAAGTDGGGLNFLLYAILEDNIRYLKAEGMTVAEETLKLKSKLKAELENAREIRQ